MNNDNKNYTLLCKLQEVISKNFNNYSYIKKNDDDDDIIYYLISCSTKIYKSQQVACFISIKDDELRIIFHNHAKPLHIKLVDFNEDEFIDNIKGIFDG